MTYFDPTPATEHKCKLPDEGLGTPRGWRCECGKAYVLEELSQHGESWWQWRRSPKHDEAAAP